LDHPRRTRTDPLRQIQRLEHPRTGPATELCSRLAAGQHRRRRCAPSPAKLNPQ